MFTLIHSPQQQRVLDLPSLLQVDLPLVMRLIQILGPTQRLKTWVVLSIVEPRQQAQPMQRLETKLLYRQFAALQFHFLGVNNLTR